jgi:glutamate synthase domain-containing protein 1
MQSTASNLKILTLYVYAEIENFKYLVFEHSKTEVGEGSICGIVGVLLEEETEVGKLLITMMRSLQHRGIDSAGVALYRGENLPEGEYILRLFTKDIVGAMSKVTTAIANAGGDIRNIEIRSVKGFGFDRFVIRATSDSIKNIVQRLNTTGISKVLSVGRKIEIIKDTGITEELDENFKVSAINGTHGIGHVRFSTESKVDLLHAHPFQSFDYPDVALVHNGQITNYWKVREELEEKSVSFETDNDSELIVHYIIDKLKQGLSLRESLKESVRELDGPFSYIISTANEVGMVRDKLGLRPLVVLEGEGICAAASEESALRAINHKGRIRNLRPGEVVCWNKN